MTKANVLTPRQAFEHELENHGLSWCQGQCGRNGHRRGFVLKEDKKVVHLAGEVALRKTLHRAMHEIGHCVNDEAGLKSWQCEEKANEFAVKAMRDYGFEAPRSVMKSGAAYVARKKRHGENIRKGMAGLLVLLLCFSPSRGITTCRDTNPESDERQTTCFTNEGVTTCV